MQYPAIHQHDASDCGPAVLAMVAAYYKKRVSIARIREAAGTDLRGANLARLSSAAEHPRFAARTAPASHEARQPRPPPARLHLRATAPSHLWQLSAASSQH